MLRSRLASLSTVAAMCVALAACGGGDGKITIGSANEVPVTTAPGGDASGDTSDGSTDATGDTTEDTTATTIGDLDQIPDLPGNLDACLELATTLSSLAASASGAPMPDGTREKIEEIRATLPDQVRDDIDTLVAGYATLAEAGGANGQVDGAFDAVNSPEFQAASERLSEYFEQNCG